MNIVIVGAGLIGKERIKAIEIIRKESGLNIEIIGVVDPLFDGKTEEVFFDIKYNVYNNLQILFDKVSTKVDWVFICTPHFETANAAIIALDNGAHILVEKPLGRNVDEFDKIIKHKKDSQIINVGFNYRFFTGVSLLLEDALKGDFGQIISVNMILAHGNSPGMEKSWKLDPILCGGGCLIDPGIHLIDLAMILSKGSLKSESFLYWDGFWKTGIEEEVHLLASDKNRTIYNFYISLNKWRSTFRIEINGTNGYGVVEGRGRSYGNQKYTKGKRWAWRNDKSQAESEIVILDSYNADDSFVRETRNVLSQECGNKNSLQKNQIIKIANESDNYLSLKLIDSLYKNYKIY